MLDHLNRLICFGDSWTAGHGVETDIQYKEVIDCGEFTNKLRNSNGWPRHLANLFDIPFVNFGWPNLSNPEIIQTIDDNRKHFEKDDLIIVMLSYPYRGKGEPVKDLQHITELLSRQKYFIFNSFSVTFEHTPLELSLIHI